MIKKYNRIFVNLSAVAGDVFAISILPLPRERDRFAFFILCWHLRDCWVSALLTIFPFSPGSEGWNHLVPQAEPI